jgi:hypothetical protein
VKKFLNRNVVGIPLWVWLVLSCILVLYFQSLWAALVFTGPSVQALRDGVKEMNDKAQEYLDRTAKQTAADETADETIDTAGEDAALKKILNYKDQQDDVRDPYMD